jgi:hypothetical protein
MWLRLPEQLGEQAQSKPEHARASPSRPGAPAELTWEWIKGVHSQLPRKLFLATGPLSWEPVIVAQAGPRYLDTLAMPPVTAISSYLGKCTRRKGKRDHLTKKKIKIKNLIVCNMLYCISCPLLKLHIYIYIYICATTGHVSRVIKIYLSLTLARRVAFCWCERFLPPIVRKRCWISWIRV